MEAFAQRARTCVLYPIDRAKPHICLIVQFFRTWMSLRAPSRNHWEPVRGSQLNMVCGFHELFLFLLSIRRVKGVPAARSSEHSSYFLLFFVFLFPASQVSSTHDRQAALMDGVVTFSVLAINEHLPLSALLSLSCPPPPWRCTFDLAFFSFFNLGQQVQHHTFLKCWTCRRISRCLCCMEAHLQPC